MKITLPELQPAPWAYTLASDGYYHITGTIPHSSCRGSVAVVECDGNEAIEHNTAQAIAATHQTLATLADVLQRIEASEQWWMASPDRGGFDAEAIRAALLAAGATIED